jgi:hypothetical protein
MLTCFWSRLIAVGVLSLNESPRVLEIVGYFGVAFLEAEVFPAKRWDFSEGLIPDSLKSFEIIVCLR